MIPNKRPENIKHKLDAIRVFSGWYLPPMNLKGCIKAFFLSELTISKPKVPNVTINTDGSKAASGISAIKVM